MTDRKLLELAAKAAGHSLVWNELTTEELQPCIKDATAYKGLVGWEPLTDDGDALRLAVALRIDIKWHSGLDDSVFAGVAYRQATQVRERLQGDNNAATRRAIVRAAAEIGRDMP